MDVKKKNSKQNVNIMFILYIIIFFLLHTT